MAWENALDRLVLQQIHLAEKGDVRNKDVERQIQDLHDLQPERPGTAFHRGYARSLLGLDLAEPDGDVDLQRWYLFGRIRGHDRRGERSWVAELLQRDGMLIDLLSDPQIAAQALPLVMRTLFWCEDLTLAVKALDYLSTDVAHENDMLVDAAVTDLLTRLEVREDREDGEPTAAILEKCIRLDSFERLPCDVRARYFRALGLRQLATSEFDEAHASLTRARELVAPGSRIRSSAEAWGALASLRLHGLEDLEPRADRPEREAAAAWLGPVGGEQNEIVPEARFVAGILAYEVGDYAKAADSFDQCLAGLRRTTGRDVPLINRTRFFLAASLLAGEDRDDASRALRLMDLALDQVRPDLESFYPVHEALKAVDRRVALKFLDAVDVGRGTAPDQLLFVALEYLGLAEAEPASAAAERVLKVAVDLDQRVEAMRVLLTAGNMRGDREEARRVFFEMRDLLMQRGAFTELENLLKNEESVGQALDHVEIKCELAAVYEEMEDRDYDRASLQTAIARSLRARKDAGSLREALGLLKEVEIQFPDLAREDLAVIEKMLAMSDDQPGFADGGPELGAAVAAKLGRQPRVLVVGGNERQRRHHPRLEALAGDWGLEAEWLMANYTSPQKVVAAVRERLETGGIDLMVLLHWNRHETTEPALELARKHDVMARNLHYAGFTSLQVCLTDMLNKLVGEPAEAAASKPEGKAKAGKGEAKKTARSGGGRRKT